MLEVDGRQISSHEESHPMGETPRKAVAGPHGAIALDTFGGGIHVEWDPAAAVTPLGQLPFFIEFLNVSGLFEAWVAECPLAYLSNHASDKRAVLATLLLSILAGVPLTISWTRLLPYSTRPSGRIGQRSSRLSQLCASCLCAAPLVVRIR